MEYLSRSKLGSDAGRSARRVLRERVNQRQGGWVQMSDSEVVICRRRIILSLLQLEKPSCIVIITSDRCIMANDPQM